MDEGCSRVMGDQAKRMEGRKRDQPSQTSSSREKRQINSRRIELPIIIGPQHRLHLGMAASFRRCQEPRTCESCRPVLYPLGWSQNLILQLVPVLILQLKPN
jgi:hypothetical protein